MNRDTILAVLVLATTLAGVPGVRAAPHDVLGAEDARHLLARTGFGPTASEVAAFAPLTRTAAVERLLAGTHSVARLPPPAAVLAQEPVRFPGPNATIEERRAFNQRNTRDGLELRAWWIQEMLTTPSPLTERMTLFWRVVQADTPRHGPTLALSGSASPGGGADLARSGPARRS